jgi:regulator of cell morphogenesis and NO signaling
MRRHVHGERADTRWEDYAPWDLVEHLGTTHHAFAWSTLEGLAAIAQETLGDDPRGSELADLVMTLRADLEAHLAKEERLLFPWIEELRLADAMGTSPPGPPNGGIEGPLRVMRADHQAVAELFARIRELAARAPEAPVLAPVLDLVRELESDVVIHHELEERVLFPMLADIARRATN